MKFPDRTKRIQSSARQGFSLSFFAWNGPKEKMNDFSAKPRIPISRNNGAQSMRRGRRKKGATREIIGLFFVSHICPPDNGERGLFHAIMEKEERATMSERERQIDGIRRLWKSGAVAFLIALDSRLRLEKCQKYKGNTLYSSYSKTCIFLRVQNFFFQWKDYQKKAFSKFHTNFHL